MPEHSETGAQRRAPVRRRLWWTLAGFGTLALGACLLAPLVGSTRIHMSAVFDQRAALYDYVLKSQLAGARCFAHALRSNLQ